MTEPEWVTDAIWWQVHPLGFVGAEPVASPGMPVVHRLEQITGWLDHLIELGANGLALQPVFASQSHGYDTVDFFAVDPRLGSEEDLLALFEECRSRGIRVLLDGVFNHVGTGHPAFQDLVSHGPNSQYADWFKARFPADWQPGQTPEYDAFEGHSQLAELNHASPAVADLVVSVMCHWLERGADGWRLDAAYAVDPSFWATVLPRVRERFPDAYIVGEVIHGDYPAIVTESTMSSLTQYELWKAIWSSLREANFWELDHALGRHNDFLDTFVPWTFVGNHDVTRIASQVSDPHLVALADVVLFTVGGTPAVYYGDEYAIPGVKEERLGGDDAIRPQFPSAPTELAERDEQVYRVHQELIALRRRHPWLHHARTEQVHLTNQQLVYRVSSGDDALLVALNNSPTPVTLPEVHGSLLAGRGAVAADGLTLSGSDWAVIAP